MFILPDSGLAQPAEDFGHLSFRFVGPSRGGRVTAVTGHRAQPSTFYMGATGGGVWKTTDNGTSWRNISDGYFQTASIGSIDVADSDPRVVYVGTGSEGLRSNVIIGRGVYKSVDEGESWTFVGLRDAGQIGSVVVHPTNPDVVYAAALGNPFGPNSERGVYKTVNGGESWQQILYVSDRTGAVDLELNPANPDIVYAALWHAERKPWTIISGDAEENGIYVSSDAGNTWQKSSEGLPSGLTGKIDFAVSPADPSRLYALVEAKPEEEGLYRSNDRGVTWTLVNNAGYLMTRPFYYTNVDADPTDADVVWVNNLGLWKSSDAGHEFERIATPHGDNHDMWINPDNPSIIVQSNDGGANVTLDGGQTWSTQLNQPTAELYQVDVDNQFPYWVYAGQQDNTTIAVPSIPPDARPGGPIAYWEAVGGCETGPAVPHPVQPHIVYSNCKGTFSRFNRRTGQSQNYYVGGVNMYGVNPRELPYRFQRVVPIEISPHDPSVIYHGSQYVHRTQDEGRTWETISGDLTAFRPERQVVSGSPITRDITGEEHYSALYVIEVSPLSAEVIWTGANDGPVHVTTDGGQTWTDVTPPAMPPEGRIQTIDPSLHDAATAYVAGYRYLLGDFRPYIYKTTDYGQSWTLLTDGHNGIPADTPTRVVREDPDREGLLYAGTEFGLYISFDDGGSWKKFQQGLPVTPVTGIRVHQQDLVVSTMGRGFWILDNVTSLHADLDAVTQSQAHLFPVQDAYRLRYRSGRRSETDPQYPPVGMVIDYYFQSDQIGEVTLNILDNSGDVIRSFVSDALEPELAAIQEMRQPPPVRLSRSGLQAGKGMHRFIWDLRHDTPSGPMAVPGDYTIELSSQAWSMTQAATLHMDPRVAADGVAQQDLEAQLAFSLEVKETRAHASKVAAHADSLIGVLGDKDTNGLLTAVADLHAMLVTERGDSYPQPMLIDQLRYLDNFTSSGDHMPGQDAYDRLSQLKSRLNAIEREIGLLYEQIAALSTASE